MNLTDDPSEVIYRWAFADGVDIKANHQQIVAICHPPSGDILILTGRGLSDRDYQAIPLHSSYEYLTTALIEAINHNNNLVEYYPDDRPEGPRYYIPADLLLEIYRDIGS